MSATIQNAPLVELIAEVRWRSTLDFTYPFPGAGESGPAYVVDSKELEEFYTRFAAKANDVGFVQGERLIPEGAPAFLNQPGYRFKKTADGACLYQIGPGVFSTNAVPPYQSWDEFAPVLQSGIEALLAARSESEAESPFAAVSLRYIDLFGEELLDGKSSGEFVRDVLGLRLAIPATLTEHCPSERDIKPFLQLHIPLKDALIMSLGVGEGVAANRSGVIMDTSITTTVETAASIDAIMQSLNNAHLILDTSFRKLIEPIKHLMPTKGE